MTTPTLMMTAMTRLTTPGRLPPMQRPVKHPSAVVVADAAVDDAAAATARRRVTIPRRSRLEHHTPLLA